MPKINTVFKFTMELFHEKTIYFILFNTWGHIISRNILGKILLSAIIWQLYTNVEPMRTIGISEKFGLRSIAHIEGNKEDTKGRERPGEAKDNKTDKTPERMKVLVRGLCEVDVKSLFEASCWSLSHWELYWNFSWKGSEQKSESGSTINQ